MVDNKKLLFGVMVMSMLTATFLYAEEKDKTRTSSFDERWLKAVVSIEINREGKEPLPIGTGFLVESSKRRILLVTAKHVILNEEGKLKGDLVYRLNNKQGKSYIISELELEQHGYGTWFLSLKYDLASRFLGIRETSDMTFISSENILPQQKIQVGAPLLILGFPFGLRSTEYAVPIARRAMVARSEQDNIIVDGFVFPGNSGGPVVYNPTFKIGSGLVSPLFNYQYLIGLVSKYIPYTDVAVSIQTKRPRITFEENSGLTDVVPTDAIIELINREDVITMENKIGD